jgi:hypothetical protein
MADGKEDDYDVLDDKSPSASSDFPQKIQTAYSFLFELLMLPILCL